MQSILPAPVVAEVLAVNPFETVTVWWTQSNGRAIRIHWMREQDLCALFYYLQEEGHPIATAIVECVLHETYLGMVRYDFLQLCKDYQRHPETRRMEVVFNLKNAN